MANVNATFTLQLNGAEEVIRVKDAEYKNYWYAQQGLIDVLQMTSRWGLGQLFGEPDPFAGMPSDGDVSIHYVADFGGAHSTGGNVWNGIPGPAAEQIFKALKTALAGVTA